MVEHKRISMRATLLRASVLLGLMVTACAPAAAPAPTAAPAKPAAAPTQAPAAAGKPADASKPAEASKPAAAAPVTPRGGQVTIAVRREAGELDIHKPSVGTTRQYARALYNALFRVSLDGQVSGELIERWETPDPRTYVFHVRPGVTFHDGTAVDAQAIKFNLDRLNNPETKAFYRTQLVGIESVEVIDAMSLRLKLTEPDGTLPARLSDGAGWVVSPAGVEKWGEDFATHPVGSGPFEFVDWVKDDHLTLKRFANYWEKDKQGQQLPYLDGLTFKPIADLTVMLTGLRTGTIDIAEAVQASDLPTIRADSNLKVVEGPGNLMVLWLNMSKPPFDNKALRQAVAWGFDREAIHRGVYFGTGSVAQYLLPPMSWALDPKGPFPTLDVARTKAKLAEGNQPNGFSFQALVNNTSNDMQLAQAVQGQLAAQGIRVELIPLTSQVNADRRLSGDFEGSFSNLTPTTDPDQHIYSYIRTGQGVNRSRYSNPKVDELLDKARQSTDQATRRALYFEAQPLIIDDSPVIFLHHDADLKGVRARVDGFEPSVDSFVRVTSLSIKQ
jgi:peptide/nickel transport system substrate-binding protein